VKKIRSRKKSEPKRKPAARSRPAIRRPKGGKKKMSQTHHTKKDEPKHSEKPAEHSQVPKDEQPTPPAEPLPPFPPGPEPPK